MARTKGSGELSRVLAVRLTAETDDKLEQLAKTEQRKKSDTARLIIEDNIDDRARRVRKLVAAK